MPGVPHRGWECVGTEDLGEPSLTCEMCEQQEIRYVHFMAHPNYPVELRCGCVCAGHMEGNGPAADDRDKRMKSSARRRLNFPALKGWRESARGYTIRINFCQVTVFRHGGGWRAVASMGDRKQFARGTYPDLRPAQLAAFDCMEYLVATKPPPFTFRVDFSG